MQAPLITMERIGKTFAMGRGVTVPAVRNVSMTIEAGEFISIVGPSGSGKSSLMYIIGLLMKPSAGRYLLQGRDVSRCSENELADIRNQDIGFVFQGFNLLEMENALQNVLLPTMYRSRDNASRVRSAREKLELVGLAHRSAHLPGEMSGGEQQRVAIARALVNEPKIILADEPTGNLDSRTGEDIISVFRELNRARRTTVVIVTHDQRVERRVDRTIRLLDGEVV